MSPIDIPISSAALPEEGIGLPPLKERLRDEGRIRLLIGIWS